MTLSVFKELRFEDDGVATESSVQQRAVEEKVATIYERTYYFGDPVEEKR